MNFITAKQLAETYRDHGAMDGNDTNALVYDACTDALDRLDDDQRAIVEREAKHLEDTCHRLGRKGALELLASVAHLREI